MPHDFRTQNYPFGTGPLPKHWLRRELLQVLSVNICQCNCTRPESKHPQVALARKPHNQTGLDTAGLWTTVSILMAWQCKGRFASGRIRMDLRSAVLLLHLWSGEFGPEEECHDVTSLLWLYGLCKQGMSRLFTSRLSAFCFRYSTPKGVLFMLQVCCY